MDIQSYGKKIAFLWIFCTLIVYIQASTENTVWIGSVKDIRIGKVDSYKLAMTVYIDEYIAEGTFDDFDENKILFIDKNAAATEWSIILDNVAACKWKNRYQNYTNKEMLFLQSLAVEHLAGSFSDPNLTQSKQGKALASCKLILTGSSPMHINLEKIDKSNTSEVVIYFTLTDQVPGNRLISKKKSCMLEVSVEDFEKERTVGHFLSKVEKLSPQILRYLDQLQRLPTGTFVTLVYRARYVDVNTLDRNLEKIKSDLGIVEVVESGANIIIRDRAEYVLEMMHLLLAIDVPIPQVMIDVQIIERTCEEGSDFSSTFRYLHDSQKNSFDGSSGIAGQQLRNTLEGEHISGVYRHLENDFLNHFQFQINSEIQEGKATLKARPRIICKNREIAKFNSGKRIPYYQFREYLQNDRNYQYNTNEKSESGSDNPGSDTSFTKRNFNYEEKEAKNDRRWYLEFIDTGVNLWLQPYIKNSEWVELILKPSYSEIVGVDTMSDIPVLANRSLETTVTVKNGDTFLLAGLLYEKELEYTKGVPVLMDIPLLGSLFTSHVKKKQQTEVIFVLTVNIHFPGQ